MKIDKRNTPVPMFHIGDAQFDDLLSAGTFALTSGIELELNEWKAGFDLGALMVAVSEYPLDHNLIASALVESTDSAYKDAAKKLIIALQRFVDIA